MSWGAVRPAAILANFGFDLHPRAVDALCARVCVTRDRRQRERCAAKPDQLDGFAGKLEQLMNHRHGSSPKMNCQLCPTMLIEHATRTPCWDGFRRRRARSGLFACSKNASIGSAIVVQVAGLVPNSCCARSPGSGPALVVDGEIVLEVGNLFRAGRSTVFK